LLFLGYVFKWTTYDCRGILEGGGGGRDVRTWTIL